MHTHGKAGASKGSRNGHAHAHAPRTAPGRTQQVLRLSLLATLAYVLLTFFAGIRAHSLALISESGHNVSDFLALLLSFIAVYFQTRPATDEKTFGYQRAGVLAAFLNALTLVMLSVWIGLAALHRFGQPVAVQPRVMMIVAAFGLAMNASIAVMLSKAGDDVNIRSVFLHMLTDALSTAAVILGGGAILFTGLNWIDPALSLLIAALILSSSLAIVRETLNILLEGTPSGVSLPEIRISLQAIAGVENIHDLHVWSLGSQTRALATHVTIADIPTSETSRILTEINQTLRTRFRIHHTTIQFENADCEVAHGCAMPVDTVTAHNHGHSHDGHSHDGHSHGH